MYLHRIFYDIHKSLEIRDLLKTRIHNKLLKVRMTYRIYDRRLKRNDYNIIISIIMGEKYFRSRLLSGSRVSALQKSTWEQTYQR